mmetsp:Transcript_225/g.465  ORF Transcript_225/g.465 Transcript_225/m.465 type:complete len:284 (+) Transcript_225:2224-3075(+)
MSSSSATTGSFAPRPRGRRRRLRLASSGSAPSAPRTASSSTFCVAISTSLSSSSSSAVARLGPRRRFLDASSASSWGSSGAAPLDSSSSGRAWKSPETKPRAAERACCKGRGIDAELGSIVRRSWVMVTAGSVARRAAAAALRTSSGPPALATSADSAAAACRATTSSPGRSIRLASSSITSDPASGLLQPPRPRSEDRRKAVSRSRSCKASFRCWEELAASSASAASASPSSPMRSSSLRSFFARSSPLRRTRSAHRTWRKIAGWKSRLHCCPAPSAASSER